MPIHKLEQLRKYIFDIFDIEIERIRFEQFLNSKNLSERLKLFRYAVYRARINRRYDSLIERNRKRGMLLPF